MNSPDLQRLIWMLVYDSDDRLFTQEIVAEKNPTINFQFFDQGDELLNEVENLKADKSGVHPELILVDLHLDPMRGLYVVKKLKNNPFISMIPVVVLGESSHEEEIQTAYELGANSFISKPTSNAETEVKISSFIQYWFSIVHLPKLRSTFRTLLLDESIAISNAVIQF